MPRIKEIINAAKTVSTPIIKAQLANPFDEVAARLVKGCIECTRLGQVCSSISEVYDTHECYVLVLLDLPRIAELHLHVSARTVRDAMLAAPKLKIRETDVHMEGEPRCPHGRPGASLLHVAYWLRAPASCVLCAPEAQGSYCTRGAKHGTYAARVPAPVVSHYARRTAYRTVAPQARHGSRSTRVAGAGGPRRRAAMSSSCSGCSVRSCRWSGSSVSLILTYLLTYKVGRGGDGIRERE